MGFHRAALWIAVCVVIALASVSALIVDPLFRTLMALLAVMPLIYLAVRVALGSERRVAQQRRRFLKLRAVTDEFAISVRNLNRLTVIAKTDPSAPEDTSKMIEDLVQRMHVLVERMKEAAGEEDPGIQPLEPMAAAGGAQKGESIG